MRVDTKPPFLPPFGLNLLFVTRQLLIAFRVADGRELASFIILDQANIESGNQTLWLLAKYDQKTELDVLHLETQIDLLQFHDGEDLQKHIDNLQELFNDF
ncbi:hypothetical protein R1flu_027300 [Riccia fluitans]|uniref:Uncharacterized protein n=1 Tax=Riccia fluitans TaxID=41844 RepID=A0ABD1XIE4_9MARC